MNAVEYFESTLNRLDSKMKFCVKSPEELADQQIHHLTSFQIDFTNQLNQLEFNFIDFENYLVKELELLESSQSEMRKGLKSQNTKLQRMLKAIPDHVLKEAAENITLQSPTTVQPASSSETARSGVKKVKSGEKTAPSTSSSNSNSNMVAAAVSRSSSEPAKPAFKKSIDLITKDEFAKIPSYVIGRTPIDKLNSQVAELNQLLKDKLHVLAIPEHKLIKQHDRELVYSFKSAQTKQTKGLFFFTEKEIREKQGWTSSKFTFSASGRNVLTVLRTLGRLKEVRGGQVTRYVLI